MEHIRNIYSTNLIIQCIVANDLQKLETLFECDPTEEELYEKIQKDLISVDENNMKTPIMLASMMGNVQILEKLLECDSIDVNFCNSLGYTAIHLAVAWGHIDCIKLLAKSNANLTFKTTTSNETPHDIGLRYKRHDIVVYLNYMSAKRLLENKIKAAISLSLETDKMRQLSKEERLTLNNLIQEKQDVVKSATEDYKASTMLFKQNRVSFNRVFSAIVARFQVE